MILFNKNFVDINKFTMMTDSPIEGKKARLILSFRDANPRFTVYTGASGKDGIISFPMDIVTFSSAMSFLKHIAIGQKDYYMTIASLTNVYEDNKMTNEKRLVSSLVIGKNKEGIIYMGLLTEYKPKIIFQFKSSPYHIFKDNQGNILNDEEVSKNLAIGTADVLLGLASQVLTRSTQEYYEETGKITSIQSKQTTGTKPQENKVADAEYEDITY